jgi:hypothetical protein
MMQCLQSEPNYRNSRGSSRDGVARHPRAISSQTPTETNTARNHVNHPGSCELNQPETLERRTNCSQSAKRPGLKLKVGVSSGLCTHSGRADRAHLFTSAALPLDELTGFEWAPRFWLNRPTRALGVACVKQSLARIRFTVAVD